MHYLASFYKNKAEHLQERVNFLKSLLIEKNIYFFVEQGGIENWTLEDIDRWIDLNAGVPDKTGNRPPMTPEDRESMRNILRKKIAKAKAEMASRGGEQSSSSREEELRRENARRHAEAAQAAQAEQDRARRQAEADERWRQKANQASAEEAARRSGAGAQASSGPQTSAGETPRTGKDPFEEFAERVRQGYREAYQSGADEQRRRYAARDAEFDEFNRQQEARWAESDERIRADEEARKFSNRAKKAASGAWEATKTTVAKETSTPTIDALGRYAQRVARDPSGTIGGAAKSAWETISSAAGYAAKNPAKAAASSLKNVAKFGVLGLGPLVAGHYAGKAADTAMEKMGFERNEAEDSIKVAGADFGIPFSDKPSARSSVSSAADWAAMNTGFQVASNLSRGAPLLAGAGSAGVAGAAAGFVAPAVAYGSYKVGKKIGEKTGLHDWLAGKIQGSPNSAGYTRRRDYPSVAELQAQTLFNARKDKNFKEREAARARYSAIENQLNND